MASVYRTLYLFPTLDPGQFVDNNLSSLFVTRLYEVSSCFIMFSVLQLNFACGYNAEFFYS